MDHRFTRTELEKSQKLMKKYSISYIILAILYLLLSLLPWNLDIFYYSALFYSPCLILALICFYISKLQGESCWDFDFILITLAVYFIVLVILDLAMFLVGIIILLVYECNPDYEDCSNVDDYNWPTIIMLGIWGVLVIISFVLTIYTKITANELLLLVTEKMKKYQEPLMDNEDSAPLR